MSGTQHVPSRDRPRFRAPHRRGARVAVAVVALGVLAVPIARDAAASGAVEATNNVSADPLVVIDGGTADQRQTVLNAVDRYLSVGLALPDLRVQFHTGGKAGCGGFQGLFHPEGDIARDRPVLSRASSSPCTSSGTPGSASISMIAGAPTSSV